MVVRVKVVCSDEECDVALELLLWPGEVDSLVCDECGCGLAVVSLPQDAEFVQPSLARVIELRSAVGPAAGPPARRAA